MAESDAEARDHPSPFYRAGRDRIGAERGGPDTVASRIARTVTDLGVQRFDLKYSAGQLPRAAMMRSIGLFGSEVVPRVRKLLADGSTV